MGSYSTERLAAEKEVIQILESLEDAQEDLGSWFNTINCECKRKILNKKEMEPNPVRGHSCNCGGGQIRVYWPRVKSTSMCWQVGRRAKASKKTVIQGREEDTGK
jgi:hypothetical protein